MNLETVAQPTSLASSSGQRRGNTNRQGTERRQPYAVETRRSRVPGRVGLENPDRGRPGANQSRHRLRRRRIV